MSPALPPALQRQFVFLERRLWRMDALLALSGAAGSLLLSFFFQFASDRLWDTPPWLRAFFALAGWAGFVFFASQYGARWVWGRRSLRTLAVIVQKRHRRLGDRLLGIVELADADARPANFSPELCRAAIDQVAGEASSFDFQQAVSTRKPRKYLAGFLVLGLVIATFAVVAPAAGWNTLLRWLWPASAVSRYTFVSLRDLPDHLVVAQGEPFDLTVGLSAHSYWHPQRASSHFEGQASSQAPIRDNAATFHLAGQTQPRRLWLSVGDVTRSIDIEPALRPDLRQLRVHLDLPGYLRYPPQDQRIETGTLGFLPGTKAVFSGEAVRDLRSASVRAEKTVPLAVRGNRFSTPPMLLEAEGVLAFSWQDAFGLAGPAPAAVRLAPKEDQPPEVELRGLEAAIAILPGEVVPIDLSATDDYGVQRLALTWQIAAPSPNLPEGALHELKISEGHPQAKTLAGHYDFSPALLNIPADSTVLVRATAIDYYPARTPSATPLYRIHVLGPEEHARLVHDEFEKLMARLEELTRQQEMILQSGKELEAHKQELPSEESAEKLAAQEEEQKNTADQLRALAEKTAGMVKEALRNPQISPATVREWAHHAESMRGLATQQMPAAAQTLSSAQADAPHRDPKLQAALNQEQSILDQMRGLEKEANESLERLMAQTLAGRLRKVAATEQDLAGHFLKMLPETIGMTAAQLPGDTRRNVELLAASHAGVTAESGRLHEEISRLFDRTALARYGDVAGEMESRKIEEALGRLGEWMKGNEAVQSIDSARDWSNQFGKWADRLSESDQGKSSASGAGAGGNSAAQMQALLALMRLRQQQEQVRDQTGAVDEQKGPDYPAKAAGVAASQSALRDQLRSLQQDSSFPIPPAELEPSAKAMGDASALLAKPDTGRSTTGAQTDAINLLDGVIMKHASESGANMAALMNMMGVGAGAGGTGSTAGGTTNQENINIAGTREGDASENRRVSQATGLDQSPLPIEFRDAIESYHRALEQSPAP